MTRYLLSLTLSVSIAIAILALFSPPSHADIPQMISYQGKVNDSGGTPVADGAYTMRFRIYDDAGAGNLEWDSSDQSVQVTGGVFNVMLGESPQPAIDLEFDEDYWLLVTIETDDQLPRVRVASVGYAYMASGLAPGTEVSGLVNSGTRAAIKGVNTATTGATCGGRFESYSTSGRAVYGQATATTGTTYGGRFLSYSTSGRGVYGYAYATTGTNYGVYGNTNSPSGYAGYFEGDAKVTGDLTVDGALTAPGMGDISAVNAGTGMDGGGTSGDVTLNVEVPLSLTGSSAGIGIIEGYNSSTDGKGVYGYASATTGTNYGVYGNTNSPSGYAGYFEGDAKVTGDLTVDGALTAPGMGDISAVNAGTGMDGGGTSGDVTLDVEVPLSLTGSSAGIGIIEGSNSSTDGKGVYGYASATTGTNYGVYGNTNSPSGYAGYFEGDAKVTGDLTVDGALTAPGMGDISAVNAGIGMDGGGTSGDVTLNVEVPLSLTGSSAGIGIIEGSNASTSGKGVYGYASATTGTNYGVYGTTNSPSGYAGYFEGDAKVTGDLTVDGALTAPGMGDISAVNAGTGMDGGGTSGDVTLNVEVPLSLSGSSADGGIIEGYNSSTSGRGVYGEASATVSITYGGRFESASTAGRGVYGWASATAGNTYGVRGESHSTSGSGVYGYVSATSGTNYGVYGTTNSPSGYAGYFEGDARVTGNLTVNGALTAPGMGDITAVNAGTGLDGGGTSGDVTLSVEVPLSLTGSSIGTGTIEGYNSSTDGYGVYGEASATTGTNYGGRFESASSSGRGVCGVAFLATGQTYGVYGRSNSTDGRGVYGKASATTGTNYGVYGTTNSPSGYAGYFEGDAKVTGDLTVDGALTAPGMGDISAVNAGTGMYGGGASGDVTLNVDVPLSLTAISGNRGIIEGSNASTSGRGVYGEATANTGTTYGGRFESVSTSGSGVYGYASSGSGTTFGVHGESNSTNGRAVYGHAIATTGECFGGRFENGSSSGRGVFGHAYSGTGTTYGVYGKSNSAAGYGVYGEASATTGTTYGGRFESASTSGRAVYGEASATSGSTLGVYGRSFSTDGKAVMGWASATSGYTYGVFGESLSTSGSGVYGKATATTGATYGGRFASYSTSGSGVYGRATAGTGTTYGVYGQSNSAAGYGIYYSGGLAGSGSKNCVVRTSQGPTLMYCQESTESWFEDFGEGRLVDGKAHIELDPLFLETVTINQQNPLKVFVQLENEESTGLKVRRGLTGFEVENGTSDYSFWYRVVAKRKGFEQRRLDYCKAAETDSFLYPELREKELREREEERVRMEDERARLEEDRARLHRESTSNEAELGS